MAESPTDRPGTWAVIAPQPPLGPHALSDVLCSRPRCVRLADGWLEGVPYCCECAEETAEREFALDLNPWLVLPDLEDR